MLPNAADLLKVADLQMDVQHRRVPRADKIIALSPREFDVLQVLMQEPGRIFSRTELCERIWHRDHEYDTRTVEIFITRLRKKVDADFPTHLIHTLSFFRLQHSRANCRYTKYSCPYGSLVVSHAFLVPANFHHGDRGRGICPGTSGD